MEESHSLIGSHLNGVFMWYIINFKWTLDTYIKKFCSSKVSVTFDEKTFYLGMKMVNYEEIIKIVLKALKDTYTKLSNPFLGQSADDQWIKDRVRGS